MRRIKIVFQQAPILLLGLLIACRSAEAGPSPTATMTPLLITEAPLSSFDAAATSFSRSHSNSGCLLINPSRYHTQLDYLGILPGSTNEMQVAELLGSPERDYFLEERIWNYQGGEISISFTKTTVKYIIVSINQNDVGNLENIVRNIGCPDLIYAIDTLEEPMGSYRATQFIYLDIGVEYTFWNYPVGLTDSPEVIGYFPPQSLEDYLAFSLRVDSHPSAEKIMNWEDAVK